MTYAASETGVRSGSPIELYKFQIGASQYLYTSQEEDIADGLDTYVAIPMDRGAIKFETEINKANLKLEMPRDSGIALQYIVQPPPTPVTLYVYRYHTTDTINNKVVVWSGRVIDVTWQNSSSYFNCESTFTSLNRFGLTRTYGPSCPFTLYWPDCGVSIAAFQLSTVVDSLDKTAVTAADIGNQVDGYYTGGFVQLSIPGEPPEYRSIIDHTGSTVTINYTMTGLAVGSDINVAPGCKHNLSDCTGKFNNLDDYGGFPYTPPIVPFNGTTLF